MKNERYNNLMDNSCPPVQDIAEDDFISFCVSQLHLAEDTIRGEKQCLHYINKWLSGRPLAKDTVELFFLERKQKDISNADCNRFLHFFRHLDKYLKDRGLGNLQCANEMKGFPIVRGTIEVLTKEQIRALIDSHVEYGAFHGINRTEQLNFLHTTIIQVFAETGCRFKDVRNLKVKYVNIPQRKIVFRDRKNRETTIAYIQEELAEKLKKMIADKNPDEYVFTNANSSQMISQDFNKDLKKRAQLTGTIPDWKNVKTHIFRRSFITDLLIHGVPMALVAALAGHKDIQSTNWYFTHLEKPLREAVTKLSWVRDKVDPHVILEQVKSAFKNFELGQDNRFEYELHETGNSMELKVKIK